jgi:hypothetical protein
MFDRKDIERIDFAIYQESPGRTDGVSLWSCTPQYLESFRGMAANAVRRIQEAWRQAGLAQLAAQGAQDLHCQEVLDWYTEWLRPGAAQCKYCKAKPTCPRLRGTALEAVSGQELALAEVDSADVAGLTEDWALRVAGLPDGRLEELYELLPLVADWMKAVKWQMQDRMSAGVPMARHKLVEGRKGNRKWIDPAKVDEFAEDAGLDVYERVLASPAKVEALLKKAKRAKELSAALEGLVFREPGKPTIAAATDKRKDIEPSNGSKKDDSEDDLFKINN